MQRLFVLEGPQFDLRFELAGLDVSAYVVGEDVHHCVIAIMLKRLQSSC